jgi:hypothetical protein
MKLNYSCKKSEIQGTCDAIYQETLYFTTQVEQYGPYMASYTDSMSRRSNTALS